MGIRSTHYISRETSISVILSKLHSLDNESLGNILEEFEESTYRNYSVSDTLSDDELGGFSINNLEEF